MDQDAAVESVQEEPSFLSDAPIPNPSRVVLHEVNSFLALGDAIDAGEMVGEPDVSLPALADEVAVGQNHQIAELLRRQTYLTEMKESYGREKEMTEKVNSELNTIKRKVFVMEDQVGSAKDRVSHLKEAQRNAITKRQNFYIQGRHARREANRKRRLYSVNRAKMAEFATKTDSFLKKSDACNQIDELRKELAEIRSEMESLQSSVEDAQEVSSKNAVNDATLVQLLEQDNKLQSDITSIDSQIQLEREKQKILKKEMEALMRKNFSQVNRLRCHVQEEYLRLQQLNEEVFKLKQAAKRNSKG